MMWISDFGVFAWDSSLNTKVIYVSYSPSTHSLKVILYHIFDSSVLKIKFVHIELSELWRPVGIPKGLGLGSFWISDFQSRDNTVQEICCFGVSRIKSLFLWLLHHRVLFLSHLIPAELHAWLRGGARELDLTQSGPCVSLASCDWFIGSYVNFRANQKSSEAFAGNSGKGTRWVLAALRWWEVGAAVAVLLPAESAGQRMQSSQEEDDGDPGPWAQSLSRWSSVCSKPCFQMRSSVIQ